MTTSVWEMIYDDSVRQISQRNWKLWVHDFFLCLYALLFYSKPSSVLEALLAPQTRFNDSLLSHLLQGRNVYFSLSSFRLYAFEFEYFVMGTLCASMCHYSFAIIMTSTRIFKAIYLDLFGGDFTSFFCLFCILFKTRCEVARSLPDQPIYYLLNIKPIFGRLKLFGLKTWIVKTPSIYGVWIYYEFTPTNVLSSQKCSNRSFSSRYSRKY